MLKKRLLIIVCLILFIVQMKDDVLKLYSAQSPIFTIKEAKILAVKNAYSIQEAVMDKVSAKIELQQAKEGIRDIRKKETTVRYSLLFNIKWPEKHGMPKEIDLVTKIPEIETKINNIEQQIPYEKRKVEYETEQLYYDSVLGMKNVSYYKMLLEDSKETLDHIKRQYHIGEGSKEDVDYINKQVEDNEKEYKKSIEKYDNLKKKLSNKVGTDVSKYELETNFSTVTLTRNQLDMMVQYCLEKDFDLYKKIQARKLAQMDVDKIMDIYSSRFGGNFSDLKNYINTHPVIDYDLFITKYNNMLDAIDKPWRRYYKISFLFFSIKIPYRWFQGEYTALRYFEDEKYPLFLALLDRDKAIAAEEQAKIDLEEKIRDSYALLKELDMSYESLEKTTEIIQSEYDTALIKNKKGLLPFQELETKKQDVLSSEKAMFDMKIECNKILSMVNFYSSGFITYYIQGTQVEGSSLQSGQSYLEDTQSDTSNELEGATWYIKILLTDYKFSFGVQIPSALNITHYSLKTLSGVQIGSKTQVTKTISHMPIIYEDTTLLKVELYNEDTKVYDAIIDGSTYGGDLTLEKVEDSKSEVDKEIGTYQLVEEGLKSTLSLEVEDEYKEGYYEVFVEDILIGEKRKVSENISHLTSTFKPFENITIKLYDKENEEWMYITLIQDEEGSGILKERGDEKNAQ